MRPATPVLVVLTATGALLLTGCGAGPSAAGSGSAGAGAGTGTSPAAPGSTDAGTPGTWTTGVRPAGAVTDGRVIVGTTREPGAPTMAVGLDARTGATRWTVPLGTAADALVGKPSLLLTAGSPLITTHQQDTARSGAPGSATWQVARLDPATGRTLWTADTTGPAVAAGPDALLVEQRQGTQTAARGTVALDPADGHRLWTATDSPVLVDKGTAVLTAQDDGGVSTVLTGVDAATGSTRWTSNKWAPGTAGSRATALVVTGGHVLVAVTTTRLAGDTTVLQVRDMVTGQPVGPELPAPQVPAALLDTTDGTAVVHEAQEEHGSTTRVYGVDMTTGRNLWMLDAAQAVTATVAGGGLVWVQGPDRGYSAVDDRTGSTRASGLDLAPVLVLDGTQVGDDGSGFRSGPLPR